MSFYKLDPNGTLLEANWVYGPYDQYRLNLDNRTEHTYPVDGWYWFDSREEAEAAMLPTDPAPAPEDV